MLYLRRLYVLDTEYISNQYMHVHVKYEMTANKCSIFLTIALLYLYTCKITPEKIIDISLKRIIFCLTFICKGLNLCFFGRIQVAEPTRQEEKDLFI